MKNLFDVKDQVVVITGGTGVLGKAIALHLAEQGARVVILGRKAEVGEAIVAEIKAQGGEAMFLTTSVGTESEGHSGCIRTGRRFAQCSRRQYAGCDHCSNRKFL